MKQSHLKTTIFSWVAAIGMSLSQASSPLAPLIPETWKQYAELVAVIGTVGLGHAAADKKKEE